MKKIICLLICMALLAGCSGGSTPTETQTPEHTLRVGYGRADITPTESVPMRGYSNSNDRWSTTVTERLYSTCMAFTDESDNTVLLFHNDLCRSDGSLTPMLRLAVSKATGIPAKQIMVAATNNHSSPDTAYTQEDAIVRYREYLEAQMIRAAKDALADRQQAKMYTASAYPENLNFIRYYNLKDGSVGSGTDFKVSDIVSHYGPTDNQMQLVKFTREGKQDILMVNWQGHPHRDGSASKTNINADVVGAMRTYVETEMNCQFIYFSGASGNVNNGSRISGVTPTKDYLEHGRALGQAAKEAAASFTEVKTGKVQIIGKNYAAPSKANEKVSIDVPIFAFSIGDVAFVTAPYEMFDTVGMNIKKASSFQTTFVVTYANAHIQYVPTEFAYNCAYSYEVGAAKIVRGSAELLEAEHIAMLAELYLTK